MDKAHAETEEKLKEMEDHLRQTYERANQEIGASWTAYLKQADKEIEGLQKEYDKAKESGDPDLKRKTGIALSKAKKEKTFQNAQYQRQAAQLAEDLKHINETAVAYVNDQLPEVYAVNYNNLADSVDGVGGYSFTLVDAQTVKNLALEDETLLPYKKVDGRKDVRWNTKIINAEVEQGILQGESMQEIADRLFNITAMEANAAIRNARTSVTSAEGKGRFDSYVKADSDGIIMEIEWVATPGKRTRESHAKLDGKRVKPGEPFNSILGLIRYPGDPEAEPANVYNCRCTTIAVVLGFRKKQIENVTIKNVFGDVTDSNVNKFLKRMPYKYAVQYRNTIENAPKKFTKDPTGYRKRENVINFELDEIKDMEGWVAIHEATHYLDFNKVIKERKEFKKLVRVVEDGKWKRDANGKVIKKEVIEYLDQEHHSITDYLSPKYFDYETNLDKKDYLSLLKVIGCDENSTTDEKFDGFMKTRRKWEKEYENKDDLKNVYDVISGITYDEFAVSLIGGHDKEYWEFDQRNIISEALASYAVLKTSGREDLLQLEKTIAPNLFKLLEEGFEKLWE